MKDDQQQSPDDNNNNDADMFLSKLAEALSARGSYDWKVRVLGFQISNPLVIIRLQTIFSLTLSPPSLCPGR
jgi:hypothetical protein